MFCIFFEFCELGSGKNWYHISLARLSSPTSLWLIIKVLLVSLEIRCKNKLKILNTKGIIGEFSVFPIYSPNTYNVSKKHYSSIEKVMYKKRLWNETTASK